MNEFGSERESKTEGFCSLVLPRPDAHAALAPLSAMLGFLLTRPPTVAGPVQPLTGSVSITSVALSPAAPVAALTAPDPRSPALPATTPRTPCIRSSSAGAGKCSPPRTPCIRSSVDGAGRSLPPKTLHLLLMRWCGQWCGAPAACQYLRGRVGRRGRCFGLGFRVYGLGCMGYG
jgi:hypothetical protein